MRIADSVMGPSGLGGGGGGGIFLTYSGLGLPPTIGGIYADSPPDVRIGDSGRGLGIGIGIGFSIGLSDLPTFA